MKKTIAELKSLLEKVENKGYTLITHGENVYGIDDIIDYNLEQHIKNMVKKYNVHNSDKQGNFKIKKKVYLKEEDVKPELWKIYKDKGEMPYKTEYKDFVELAREISKFYKEVSPKDKLNEVMDRIPVNREWSYPLRHNKKLYDMLENSGKNVLIQLFKDKIMFKVYIEKDKYPLGEDEWKISSYYEYRTLFKDLFYYLWDTHLSDETMEQVFPYKCQEMYWRSQPITISDVDGKEVAELKVNKNGKMYLTFLNVPLYHESVRKFNLIVKQKNKDNKNVLVVEND